MIVYTPARAADHIPVIDLTGSFADGDARRRVAWDIHRACRETGFFYVIGHGVPEDLMTGQLAAAGRFFDQPVEAKRRLDIAQSACRRGYEDAGMQVLDPGSPADLKESFMLGREVPHQGVNQWPEGLPGFAEQIRAYEAEMVRLGSHLIGMLAQSVDLPYDHFSAGLADPQCGVRLLRYSPQPVDAAFNLLGAGAHSDWGSITILLQDDVGGLEVRNADGDWIFAAPVPGSFVINIGQMMELFTAGIYRANLHRVRNAAADRYRHSVATFFELDAAYRMRRAPTCTENEDAPDEAPLTIGEHIEAMARASYGG